MAHKLIPEAGGKRGRKHTSTTFAALKRAVQEGNVPELRATLAEHQEESADDDIDKILLNDGEYLLTVAVEAGQTEVVQNLLDAGADPDGEMFSMKSRPPLLAAVSHSNIEILELLVNNGADVNTGTATISALIVASLKGHLESVRLLVEHGADIDACVDYCEDPEDPANALTAAVLSNSKGVVLFLLEQGADVDRANAGGDTPLIFAVTRSTMEIVRILVEHGGADITLRNNEGWSAQRCARRHRSREMLWYLLEHGGEIDEIDERGMTLLMSAAGEGNLEECRRYLQMKANVLATSRPYKCTALISAVNSGDAHTVELLLRVGAEVNVQPNCEFFGTALHQAVRHGFTDVVHLLLQHGAIVSMVAQTHHRTSPLQCNCIDQHGDEIAQLLLGLKGRPDGAVVGLPCM